MIRPTEARRPARARGLRRPASRLAAALGVATLLGACAAGPTGPVAAPDVRVRHDGTTTPPPSDSTARVAGNYQNPLV